MSTNHEKRATKRPLKVMRNLSTSKSFWQKLKKPFFALAPMANVTDFAFRKMIAKYGKPDVMWTEFVSADGLISAGQSKLLHNLKYSKSEKPIVAQLFTSKPSAMCKAAVLIAELGFDGLDINMGCPDKAVIKQGGGAALMNNPELAIEIINAAREGVSKTWNIPISVKTRIGYSKIDWDWLKLLLLQKLPALTIHLRTRKEMSDVPAHWELMPEIIKMRDEISPDTLIIGNGDVQTVEDGNEKAKKYGCDGIMIGRGVFGKPWTFGSKLGDMGEKTPAFRLKVMMEHAKLFEKTFKNIKNFDVMKKHFKAYVSGWNGAKELRVKLMETKNAKEVACILNKESYT
jgi:nifR3 family TIM-barrel protein